MDQELRFETLHYKSEGAIATITLNRPDDMNTIVPPMTDEIAESMAVAERDSDVKVIVIRGAGRTFCAGFNFGGGFHQWDDGLVTEGAWDAGKDFIMTTSNVTGWVPKFMSLWNCLKPVIAMVHGYAVGGGSELALCADIVIMSDDARIGTPYSRMWGCHHAGMWVHRLGMAKAKEYALTGRPLSGPEAVEAGLVNKSVPFEQLESEAYQLAAQLATIPASQLACMKLIVNQAYENMGLKSTQLLGSVLDGNMRNTPEALEFIKIANEQGVPAAVKIRDGIFGDYSQAPNDQKPSRSNVYPAP